jgi:hypothetical protein
MARPVAVGVEFLYDKCSMANPNVQYNGGPVIGNIEIVPVIWGNGWPYNQNSPLPGQLLQFLQFFVGPTSPNMAMLNEYSAGGIQIKPGSVVGNKVIIAPGNPSTALSDGTIQLALLSWISNQSGQTPGFPQPNANTLYMVFVPQNVTVTLQGQTNCGNFAGYHQSVASLLSATNILYAVIACCSAPNTAFPIVLNGLTAICSHEISESITDPGVVNSSGWLDTNTNPHDEIGDICQGSGYPQFSLPVAVVAAGAGQSFSVQSIWSHSQQNCVYGPPTKLANIGVPQTVYGGLPISGTVNLTNPVPAVPTAGTTISLSSNNPAVQFNPASVTIPPGAATAPISATTTGVLTSVVVTVEAKLGAVVAQQDITVLAAAITTFEYTPASATGFQHPPNAPKGALTLNVAAPVGGLTVGLVSSEPLLAVPVPDEIPVAGDALAPTVPFYLQVNPAGATTPVTITASVEGSSIPFKFKVLAGGPPNVVVESLTVSPSTVIGGADSFGHFTLASAVGAGGGNIEVSSSDTTVATVPATVPLAAGATGGQFTIQTKGLQQPTPVKSVTISTGIGPGNFALLTVKS